MKNNNIQDHKKSEIPGKGRKDSDKQTQVVSGTTIDNEGDKGSMRSPLEREENDIIVKNRMDREKYHMSSQDKDINSKKIPK